MGAATVLLATASYTWLRVMSIVCSKGKNRGTVIEPISERGMDAYILQCMQNMTVQNKP